MKRIFKYKLPRDGETVTISAHVIQWLEIKTQGGWPYIWAIVDDEGYPYDYEFIAWGTGWEVPEELNHCRYMGTAIDMAGFVWHYFMQQVAYATGLTTYDYVETPRAWETSTTAAPGYPDPYSVTISCGDAVTYTNTADCTKATPLMDDASIAYVESLISSLATSRGTANCSALA